MEDVLRESFLVVERVYDDNDEVVDTKPDLRIYNVPSTVPIKDLKSLVDQSCRKQYQWGLYTIITEEEWHFEEDKEIRDDDLEFALESFDGFDYEELLDKLNDEKRITLRLPNALHYALSQASGKDTLNSFCIKVLADAVNYGDRLQEFEAQREAQRRKPGRPKKVQDSE